MTSLDLGGVAAFVAVVRHRHFGAAADELELSVSAVTKRIQRLEAELGVPLIERDSGGFLGLTAAGRRFYQVAPQILQSVHTARLAAALEPVLALKLAIPEGMPAVAPLMPAAMATTELALSHAYPGVSIEMVATPFDRLTSDLLDETVDAVLTFGPSADDRIASVQLGELRRVGLVAATHPFAYRASVDAAEFARQPMPFTPGIPEEYMHPFLLLDVRPAEQARFVPNNATNTAQVAQRILGGREVTVVPSALTTSLPAELKAVELTNLPACHYYAQHRAADDRAPLRTMLELMADFVGSLNAAARATPRNTSVS